MSAKANWTPKERQGLVDLLERFNVSVESFDGLRSDAYEHALARHSLEHLELLYSELLKPGQAAEETQTNCPPWPPGTARAGRQPSSGLLSQIAERLRTESTLNSLGRVSGFLETIRNRASALPAGNQGAVLDTICTLVGEEMIAAKLAGGAAMAGMLKPLDRLLENQGMKTKAQFEQAKIELRKQAEARAQEKLDLERQKFRKETLERVVSSWIEDQQAQRILTAGGTNADKIEKLGALMFGDDWKTETLQKETKETKI